MLYLKVKMEKCRLRFDICDEQVTVLQKNVKLQESGFYVVGKILRGDDLEKNKCRGSQRNLGLCVTCRKESVGGVNEIHELRMIYRGVSIAGVYKIPENG